MPHDLEPPDWLDDGAPIPDGPPDFGDAYHPSRTKAQARRTAASYQSEKPIVDPQITFPVMAAAKKKGDVSHSPSQKHEENTRALIDAYGINVRWNLMRHSLEVTIPGFTPEDERAENASLAMLESIIVRRGLSVDHSGRHILTMARSYHPVRDWMRSRAWDGTDRLPELMATLQLAPHADPELAGLLITRWLVSCAVAVLPQIAGQRPFTPQGVLTLQGAQGKGKTEWFKSLAPAGSGWIQAGEFIDPHNRDNVQQATSHWIVEMGELDATFKKSDVAALKAFITKERDVYRSAYAKREERVPRRMVLAATVNPQSFLVDVTGNRRWWTVPIVGLTWQHEIDIQQMWAQVALMAERGDPWWLNDAELQLLNTGNRQYEIQDSAIDDLWETWHPVALSDVLKIPRVTLSEIWAALPGREHRERKPADTKMLLAALRDAGLEVGRTHNISTFRVELVNAGQRESWRDRSRWYAGD